MNKYAASFVILLSLFCFGSGAAQSPDSLLLKKAKWKSRLLVYCHVKKKPEIDKLALEYAERDISFVFIQKDSVRLRAPNYMFGKPTYGRWGGYSKERAQIRAAAGCEGKKSTIALIGKDGTVKQKWVGKKDTPDRKEVFELIDAMPMRQQEMQGK